MSTPANLRRRVRCSLRGCNADFARRTDMTRHVREVHGPSRSCPVLGCKYSGAKRRYRISNHMKKDHPQLFNVPLNIPSGPHLGVCTQPTPSQLGPHSQNPEVTRSQYNGGKNSGAPAQHYLSICALPESINSFPINYYTISPVHELQGMPNQWHEAQTPAFGQALPGNKGNRDTASSEDWIGFDSAGI